MLKQEAKKGIELFIKRPSWEPPTDNPCTDAAHMLEGLKRSTKINELRLQLAATQRALEQAEMECSAAGHVVQFKDSAGATFCYSCGARLPEEQ